MEKTEKRWRVGWTMSGSFLSTVSFSHFIDLVRLISLMGHPLDSKGGPDTQYNWE